MRRALAILITSAILAALAPRLDTAWLCDELAIGSADLPAAPSEPRDPSSAKLASALLLSHVEVLPLRQCGLVLLRAAPLGPGELHARLLERPPISPSVPT